MVRFPMLLAAVLAAWVVSVATPDAWAQEPAPPRWNLGEAVPNPFCSDDTSTTISFQLAAAAQVTLLLFRLETNDLVRVLVDGVLSAGLHAVRWDSRDESGILVPSGEYIYQINASVDGSTVFDSTGIVIQCCGDDCFFSPVATPWISFPTTTAGDTVQSTLVLSNPSANPLTITASIGNDQAIFFDAQTRQQLSTGLLIDAGTTIDVPVFFWPSSGVEYMRDIYFESFATGDTLALTRLLGEGRPISFEWTSADFYPSRTVGINDTLIIQETMDDYVEVDSLVLYFAEGGSSLFQRKKMTLSRSDPVNDRYVARLPATAGGSRGLNFYAGAYNGSVVVLDPPAESPERFRIRIDNLASPAPQPAMMYKMISFPVDMTSTTIVGVLDDDLGGRHVTNWRLFAYVTSDSTYVEIPNEGVTSFVQSEGYWLITMESATLDTAPEQVLSTPTDGDYDIVLNPGWNMIGNPFNFPVAWDAVIVDALTMDEALANMTVTGLYRWIPGSGGHYNNQITEPQQVLEPFDGYFVRASRRVTLHVPPTEVLVSPPSAPVARSPVGADGLARGDWMVEIQATSVDAVDMGNYLGVRQGALAERDPLDWPSPPMSPGQSISVCFLHSGWSEHSGPYAVDMRSTISPLGGEDGHIWHIEVAKNFTEGGAGDEVVLSFKGIESVPNEALVLLIDRKLARSIDLRSEAEYRFYLGKNAPVSLEEDVRFLLLIGSEAFIASHRDDLPTLPTAAALHQNYPNPFNPSTIIQYELAAPGRVSLRVYDVSGALVRVLEERDRKPGRYEVGWNGGDKHGDRVASGVYFYRLTTPGFTQTRKMVLLK